jgi:hypothetical protein
LSIPSEWQSLQIQDDENGQYNIKASSIRKNMISLIKKKNQARNEKPGAGFQSFPAPVLYIAWPRFRYYGHGLFLLQENNVQDDTDQHAGKHPSDRTGEHHQNGRDTGEAQDDGHHTQYLAAVSVLNQIKHLYSSSSVRF